MSTDQWNSSQYKKCHDQEQVSIFHLLGNYPFKGSETILDMGCGDGKLTAELAQKMPKAKVVGIDASNNMIQSATKLYAHIPNLSFYHANATTFALNDKFDVAFSFRALHWIDDLESVFKCLAQHLNHNAKIIFSMGAKERTIMTNAFEDICSRDEWSDYFTVRPEAYFPQNPENITSILESVGFKDIDIKKLYSSISFENDKHLLSWILCWASQCTGLHTPQLEKFAQQITQNIYEQKNKKLSDDVGFELVSLHVEAIGG